MFFDKNLSLQGNQSCATCHDPERAFIDPRDTGVSSTASLGDDLKSLGDRNTPSLSYLAAVPDFHLNEINHQPMGGLFWDGRATNLVDQAGQPILNPTEMAMPDRATVVDRVISNEFYLRALQDIW